MATNNRFFQFYFSLRNFKWKGLRDNFMSLMIVWCFLGIDFQIEASVIFFMSIYLELIWRVKDKSNQIFKCIKLFFVVQSKQEGRNEDFEIK